MNGYHYSPIDAENEIRVLELLPRTFPGASSDSLVGKFMIRKLQVEPEAEIIDYDCVSYCWGPQENFRNFRCGDQNLRITAVVDTMLRHLQKPTKSRYLWVDAMCINQSDEIEKAKQVSAMGRIYRNANKVHVWLGADTEKDRISHVFRIIKNKALALENFLSSEDTGLAKVSDAEAIPLSAFLSRPWFSRRWILQEVALAHTVTVHCGSHKLSWDWFHDALSLLHVAYARGRNTQIDNHLSTEAVQAIEISSTLRQVRGDINGQMTDEAEKEMRHFLGFLWIYHSSKCMDERDCLYALFGMMPVLKRTNNQSPYLQRAVPIDYSTPFSATFTRCAKEAIEHGLAREILHHAIAFGNLSEQNPNWPSWVPAWNNSRRSRLLTEVVNGELSVDLWGGHSSTPKYLHLKGDLHQIVGSQKSGTRSPSTLLWFQNYLRERQPPGLHFDLLNPVTEVIGRAIDRTRRFYDRNDFNFDVFSDFGIAFDGSPPLSGIISFLQKHLPGLQLETEVNMTTRAVQDLAQSYKLSSEVDRILEGCEAFCYDLGGRISPGVAFSPVQRGDFVFRPHSNRNETGYFAFVIRPISDHQFSNSGYFRLVGACVDSQPWFKELRIRKKRDALREFVSHAQDTEVILA